MGLTQHAERPGRAAGHRDRIPELGGAVVLSRPRRARRRWAGASRWRSTRTRRAPWWQRRTRCPDPTARRPPRSLLPAGARQDQHPTVRQERRAGGLFRPERPSRAERLGGRIPQLGRCDDPVDVGAADDEDVVAGEPHREVLASRRRERAGGAERLGGRIPELGRGHPQRAVHAARDTTDDEDAAVRQQRGRVFAARVRERGGGREHVGVGQPRRRMRAEQRRYGDRSASSTAIASPRGRHAPTRRPGPRAGPGTSMPTARIQDGRWWACPSDRHDASMEPGRLLLRCLGRQPVAEQVVEAVVGAHRAIPSIIDGCRSSAASDARISRVARSSLDWAVPSGTPRASAVSACDRPR